MFKDIENLKNEIEQFQANMNQTNGIIDLIKSEIELIEKNNDRLESIAQSVIDSNNEFQNHVEAIHNEYGEISANIKHVNEQYDELKELVNATHIQNSELIDVVKVMNEKMIGEKKLQIITLICAGAAAILSVVMHFI